jgi:hypothetical protein
VKGSLVVALLLGALVGLVAGYVVGSEGSLSGGALGLAAATIGGVIALLGAFGIQIRKDHRDDVRARRDRQEAVMLEGYRGLGEIRDLTLELSKARAHGQPLPSAIGINAARSHLRPTLEMIDDNAIRALSVKAIDGFAMTAEAIAPSDPQTPPASDAAVKAALERDRKVLDGMATRIGDLGRVWHGHESVPVPPAEA